MSKKNLRNDSAREQTEKLIEQLQKQLLVVPELYKKDLEIKLKEYHSDLIKHEFSDNTIKKYVRNASWFIENFSSDKEPLDHGDVMAFKAHIQDEYESVATINSYITTINRFLFYCDLGEFKVDKVKGQTDNVLKDRIYEHEFRAMYRRAKQMGMYELHYLIKVMGMTGIRVAERKSFTVESIQGLSITAVNKNKTRQVPVPQTLMRELRQFAKEQRITEGPIFKMDYHQIYHSLKLVAGQAKIKKAKIHPHAFRHYFGFRYVEKGGNIAQLSDILGHNSTDTTRVYTRGTLDDYRQQVEAM